MNIFEQEDLIKGLPDQALMKEAQQPSGQLPQYLVVSEIQRRQDMRKRFSQQGQDQPQGTVKDQILSGIAAMGQPDPTMQSAMGMQQPPQQMPQQPPMGMPQQQPMGMPQQMAPPQQPMPMPPQQQGPMPPRGMAAGGVVRMQEGRDTPYFRDLSSFYSSSAPLNSQLAMLTRQGAGVDERLSIVDQIGDIYSEGPGRYTQDEKREALLSQYTPEQIRAKGQEMGLLPNAVESLLGKSEDDYAGGSGALDADTSEQRLSLNTATKPTKDLIEAGTNTKGPSAKVKDDLEMVAGPPMVASLADVTANLSQLQNVAKLDPTSRAAALLQQYSGDPDPDPAATAATSTPEDTTYQSIISGIQELQTKYADLGAAPDFGEARAALQKMEGLGDKFPKADYTQLLSQLQKPEGMTNFSDLAPNYETMVTEVENRVKKIKEDADKEVGAQALIQLGAGLAEGNVARGLRDAGKAVSDIRKQARSESRAETQLADRMKMASKEAQMNLGVRGKVAAIDDFNRTSDAVIRQYADDRSRELKILGLEGDALAQTIALETQAAKATHAATVAEREAALNNLVKQAAVLRYQDLEKQSQRSLNRAVLGVIDEPIQEVLLEYIRSTEKPTPEMIKKKLDELLGDYLTLESASVGVEDPDPGPTPPPPPPAGGSGNPNVLELDVDESLMTASR